MADLTRRKLVGGIAVLSALPTRAALAQPPWPARPVTLVVGFPPGGPVDTVSRIIGDGLSRRLGQQIVIDNRPGAAGTTAASHVARAAPDGYALLAVPATYAATVAMYRQLPYRPIDDFTMIGITVETPLVLVTHSEHPVRSVGELADFARAQNRPLQYGTAGAGSLQHLSMELLARLSKTPMQHIPYRGGAPAIADLTGGRLDLVLDPPTALVELVRAGKLRVLGVTGERRFFAFPEAPTIAESGLPTFVVTGYQGMVAPLGLAPAIVQRLGSELAGVLSEKAVVDQLIAVGNEAKPGAPESFRIRLGDDIRRWTEVVAAANIERI
jgi:tripartite-type tricarboxylate transporter receptor subunit TctC